MALSNKQKRQVGDLIINDIHNIIEFFGEKVNNPYQLKDLKEEDAEEVEEFLISIIKRIPNNIYK